MPSPKIKNETVYVIYRNGEPYEHVKKPVYATIGPAKGQITQIAEEEARQNYDKIRTESRYTIAEWYYLSKLEKNNFIDAVKNEFNIIEYGPKKVSE